MIISTKKLLLFLAALGLICSSGLSQTESDWQWQSPWPQGNDLHTVWVLDEDHIMAGGEFGTLIETHDGGENWDVRYFDNVAYFKDLQFVSDDTGYVFGGVDSILFDDGYLFRTVNQGETWAVVSRLHYTTNNIFFLNSEIGWTSGRSPDGHILKTVDGGENWTSMGPDTLEIALGICFTDSNSGWIGVDHGTILHTEDAGETWESQRHNAGRWSFETSIAFVDDSTGWGLCTYGLIKTTNGGRTWEYQESLRVSAYDIAIINADTIIVTVSSGRIFRTFDAGENWAPLEGLSTALSIHFRNQDGWAVGNNGKMYEIFNSGETWNQHSREYKGYIFSSCFIDSLTGWMVGEFNHVYKTDDGGNTWNIQEVPENLFPRIYDVFFIDESYGWAVGNIIIATVDGGENWFEQDVDSVGLRRGFGDVCFVNRDTGWITGSISGVLVTSNGGDDWEVQDIQDIENVRLIHPIFFLNDNEGWLSNGRDMIKTTDGGESWEVFDQVVDIWEISDIFFINSDTGYAVGGDEVFAVAPMFGTGIIWRTEDGGENWEILDVRAGHQFNSITFADSLIGWAVGYSGVSYFTIDGGNHWQNYEITSEYSYSDVDFINSTTGWITGGHNYFYNDHSCVLKTMNGGYVLTIPEEKELFLPNNISILSSYPNPFNPSTTIRLGLPYTTSINVAIYNIIGQKVAQLATGRYSAGYHSIIFNASELSSGIYFIHASVPGKMNEVRKIVLMK